MAPDVSRCDTQQYYGSDITYKRMRPPGTIPIVDYPQKPLHQRIDIYASNDHGISGDHPQELLQKISGRHNAEYHLTRFTLRARRLYRGPGLNRQRHAARLQRPFFLILCHTGLPWIKCSPYTALASALTIWYPIEHRRGISLIIR